MVVTVACVGEMGGIFVDVVRAKSVVEVVVITVIATGKSEVLQKIAQVQEQLMTGRGVFWCLYFNVIKFLGSMSELQQL